MSNSNTNPSNAKNLESSSTSNITRKSTKHKLSPNDSENKRSKNDLNTDDINNTIENLDLMTDESFPRFLVVQDAVEDEDGSIGKLSRLSPFVIDRVLRGCIGTAQQVKKLQSGKLLVEVARRTQAENLLRLTDFAGVPITVSPHRGLNTSRGILRSRELASMKEEELADDLKNFNVINIQTIMTTKNGIRSPTNSVILTFNSSTLPQSLKAGYLNLKVEPYIPNPLRCFRCQRFGHHQKACKRVPVCFKCGSSEHDHTGCNGPLLCVSCGGDHAANFNKCPAWLKEREICRIKVLQNLSFPEARTLVEGRQSVPVASKQSYSSVLNTKPKMLTVSTQTEVTHCQCKANFDDPVIGLKTSRCTSTSDLTSQNIETQIPTTSVKSVNAEMDEGSAAAGDSNLTAAVGGSRAQSLSPVKGMRRRSIPPRERKDRTGGKSQPSCPSGGSTPPTGTPSRVTEGEVVSGMASPQSGAVSEASGKADVDSRQSESTPADIRKGIGTGPDRKGKPPSKPIQPP